MIFFCFFPTPPPPHHFSNGPSLKITSLKFTYPGQRPKIPSVPLWFHPRRPKGSQSGREKRRDESFQVRAEEPLGTDSHRTISKNSSGCRLLIGHKKCFVLLCQIGEQFLLSSFREFIHNGYCLATHARFAHQA